MTDKEFYEAHLAEQNTIALKAIATALEALVQTQVEIVELQKQAIFPFNKAVITK